MGRGGDGGGSARLGRCWAWARNQVCQLSLGNARFGTTISKVLARFNKTKRAGDSRHSLKPDHGMVVFRFGPSTATSVAEISTRLVVGAPLRRLRFQYTTPQVRPKTARTTSGR